MKKLGLHWKILIGMVLGVIAGLAFSSMGASQFVLDWIKPFGTVFIKLLKLIAIPLIIASLIKGISDLKDISKFSKIGLRTVAIYIFTTIIAISIGLVLVNIVQPGESISAETVEQLSQAYNTDAVKRVDSAISQKSKGPLQFFEDMIPDNIFAAASDNRNMLQVIFFTILLGISLLLVKEAEAKPLKSFFDSLNEVIMKMIDLIMLMAPYAVFCITGLLDCKYNKPRYFRGPSTIRRNGRCRFINHAGCIHLCGILLYKNEAWKVFQRHQSCTIIGFFNKFICCYASSYNGACRRTFRR